MEKINESEVLEQLIESPKGRFGLSRHHISLALGGKKDQGVWGGGHPFDVELSVLPPGKKNHPFHSHAAQWEYYIFLSGTGRFLNEEKEWNEVKAGDHIICPPKEAHQLENNGTEDLVYYVIADHHPADITTYPNTNKRHLKPEYQVVDIEPVDYYKNEE